MCMFTIPSQFAAFKLTGTQEMFLFKWTIQATNKEYNIKYLAIAYVHMLANAPIERILAVTLKVKTNKEVFRTIWTNLVGSKSINMLTYFILF